MGTFFSSYYLLTWSFEILNDFDYARVGYLYSVSIKMYFCIEKHWLYPHIRDKKIDIARKQTARNVYRCHVIGPRDAGKTTFCQVNEMSKLADICNDRIVIWIWHFPGSFGSESRRLNGCTWRGFASTHHSQRARLWPGQVLGPRRCWRQVGQRPNAFITRSTTLT